VSTDLIIDVDVLEYLPAKTMLKLVEQRQKATKHMTLFQAAVKQHAALFRYLEESDIDVDFSLRDGDINISFTGDGARLGQVWAELRRNGYTPNSRPTKGQTTFCTFWSKEDYAKFWMTFTSSVCRRVQVGTTTVEQPIYEVQCGELPELEAGTTNLVEGDSDVPF
jgi:hypothetical protein